MASIKSVINIHNKYIITEKKIQTVRCNCINKPDCLQLMPNYKHNMQSKNYIETLKLS